MVRTAFLFLPLVAIHHVVWNVEALRNGSGLVWAGAVRKFERGAHIAIEEGRQGLIGYVGVPDRKGGPDFIEASTREGAKTLIQVKGRRKIERDARALKEGSRSRSPPIGRRAGLGALQAATHVKEQAVFTGERQKS